MTGDEPMTGAQKSYLKTLSEEASEPFDDTLTKAHAAERIDELQKKTGRGSDRQKSQEPARLRRLLACKLLHQPPARSSPTISYTTGTPRAVSVRG